jgi:hypothetical protein
LCFPFRTPSTYKGQALACLKAAHKAETYRSLRSFWLAALVPSAGIISLQENLCSAGVIGARVIARDPLTEWRLQAG